MKKYEFNELKKIAKSSKHGHPQYRVAVVGDSSTQSLTIALKGYSYISGLFIDVFEADYNQIFVQVMDSDSELYKFQPDAVLIYMCTEKLYEAFHCTPEDNRAEFANSIFVQIQSYWSNLQKSSSIHVLQFNFAEYDDGIFGNFANKQESSFLYQIRKLNLLLMNGSIDNKHVFIVDLQSIQNKNGRNVTFDSKMYYIAKMTLTMEVLPQVAQNVVNVIIALRGIIKKCVILDLDNTLWGGVIGDDGLPGIQIGELGVGRAFSEFQIWLKELKKRGILLAACSKNTESIAKEPFEKHKEMVLRLEDFSIFVANWEDKASNIRVIQQTLNIGLDSMVFIDDNPFERDLVRNMIPDITVPELPEDPALYLSYLQSLNLFETGSFSEADRGRTNQYRSMVQLEELQQQYVSIDDYLKNLEMKAEVRPFDEFNFPRIAQLTQRSNQFNLRTVRYTDAEIEKITADSNFITLYFTLRDKIVDHGLISVVILEKESKETLFIDTWLMSCRVLKRGMEEFIVNNIIEIAKKEGVETIIGEYLETPKNGMVSKMYGKMGFKDIGNGRFIVHTDSFQYNKTFIEKI